MRSGAEAEAEAEAEEAMFDYETEDESDDEEGDEVERRRSGNNTGEVFTSSTSHREQKCVSDHHAVAASDHPFRAWKDAFRPDGGPIIISPSVQLQATVSSVQFQDTVPEFARGVECWGMDWLTRCCEKWVTFSTAYGYRFYIS